MGSLLGPALPEGVVYSYTVNPTTGSAFQLTFERPAVAAIVEVVYALADGSKFTSRSRVDTPLGEGARTLAGALGTVGGVFTSTAFRVWHVQYEDGTTAGELDPVAAQEELAPYRAAVRAYALRYSALARSGRRALEDALVEDDEAALLQRHLGHEVPPEDEIARGVMRSNLEAFPDLELLAARLVRMAE